MLIYPLIKEFATTSDVKNVWYADDSTSGDSIAGLNESWSVLKESGLRREHISCKSV